MGGWRWGAGLETGRWRQGSLARWLDGKQASKRCLKHEMTDESLRQQPSSQNKHKLLVKVLSLYAYNKPFERSRASGRPRKERTQRWQNQATLGNLHINTLEKTLWGNALPFTSEFYFNYIWIAIVHAWITSERGQIAINYALIIINYGQLRICCMPKRMCMLI